MIDSLTFTLGNVLSILSFILLAGGALVKVQKDNNTIVAENQKDHAEILLQITRLNKDITKIQCDRIDRWSKHDEEWTKHEAYSSEILSAINEVMGDMKATKTHIEYLRDKYK